MQPKSSSSQNQQLSATFSTFVLILTFVTGIILGLSFGNYTTSQQQQNIISPPLPSCPIPKPCPTTQPKQQLQIKSESPKVAQQQEEEPDPEQEENSRSSKSSSSCLPFMSDLKKSFLSRLDDPDASTSIIKGGTLLPSSHTGSGDSLTKEISSPLRSFREIGNSMKDDKTLIHRFDHGYETYLGHPFIRQNSDKLSIFEIGLGCNQHMGVGASAKLWGEFLPNARLAMLEFDEKCAKEWPLQEENKKLVPKGGLVVYPGDQSSPKTWKRVLEEEDKKTSQGKAATTMMYDLIIDDGGHTMEQQIATFMQLWPRVKPGGVYVIEDMNTSWKTRYQGTKRMLANSKTTNNLIKVLMDRVHSVPLHDGKGDGRKSDEDLKKKSPVHRVDCMHFICFISKRWVE